MSGEENNSRLFEREKIGVISWAAAARGWEGKRNGRLSEEEETSWEGGQDAAFSRHQLRGRNKVGSACSVELG